MVIDKFFTKKEALDLNRKEQEELLIDRKVKFKKSEKELSLVSKILNSNPEEENNIPVIKKEGLLCPKCGSDNLIMTGGGPSGKDYVCPKCGHKLTK